MKTKSKININQNSSNENKIFSTKIEKLVNYFKTLTEQEEYLITSSLLDYLFFVNTNIDLYKYYLAMLYKKFNKDTIYQYYLEHVIKSHQICELLKNFEVLVDTREYINYYFNERKNEYNESLNHIFVLQKAIFADKDEKIKHYFQQYDFIDEVKAIIKYCRYHYSSIAEIPYEYKIRIIRKIETTIFLKNASDSILEMLL